MTTFSYAQGILHAHRYLLSKYPEVFVFGQGLWSPWYVGTTMVDLDKDFGRRRIIDSPISEMAVTGAALGAALGGYRPIIVHPRMDFLILAVDQIVSQAAKWSHMFGGQMKAPITVRGIINRGGEQGAQHSQALHSWFAHIPGLRVVMPSTPADARDLLVASVLSDDPVLYIDDRWLYEIEEAGPDEPQELDLPSERPHVVEVGSDCTLVAAGYSVQLCREALKDLKKEGSSVELIDVRILNPITYDEMVESVQKTGRLCVVDGGWTTCGLAGEIIAGVVERVEPADMKCSPVRITTTDAPAPASRVLEKLYYRTSSDIVRTIQRLLTIRR